MKRYRLIPHTADIGIVAYGATLPEAFANAAYGLFAIMTDLRRVRQNVSRTIEVRVADREGLLFEWLNQLIYLFDTEMMLFRRCEITEFDEKSLRATCHGEKRDPARHEIRIGVKSATYHQLTVDPAKNQVRVIFDI